jgi:HEAT repeat protein
VKLLADPETQVRRSAAIALGVLRAGSADEQAGTALTKAARGDEDLMVRNLAYLSLGRVGGTACGDALRADLQTMTQASRPFIALGLGLLGDPASVPGLLQQLKDEGDLSMRASVAVALGLLKDERAKEGLREAFHDVEEPVFRGYAALALGLLGDHEVIADLRRQFADSSDVELIPNCATALGLLGDREAAAALVQRAGTEKNEYVLQSVLYSIGLVGDRSAIPSLTRVLGGNDAPPAYIRSYAAAGLGLLGDPAAQRAIARLSRDSNYTISSNFLSDLFNVL